jgi:hypothetical protein
MRGAPPALAPERLRDIAEVRRATASNLTTLLAHRYND